MLLHVENKMRKKRKKKIGKMPRGKTNIFDKLYEDTGMHIYFYKHILGSKKV